MTHSETGKSHALVEQGWEQGAVFSLPAQSHIAVRLQDGGQIEAATFGDQTWDHYIVVSQTCDIAANIDVEPFIDVMACRIDTTGELKNRAHGSFRLFDVGAEDIVVHAAYRASIQKSSLSGITPQPWPGTPYKLDRFQEWLAKRAGRKALPDSMVRTIVQPIRRRMDRIRKKSAGKVFNRLVREIRISFPKERHPPFSFHLILIMEGSEVSEDDLAAVDSVIDQLKSDFESPEGAKVLGIHRYTAKTMSVEMLERTILVDLDAITFGGDEIRGVEPIRA